VTVHTAWPPPETDDPEADEVTVRLRGRWLPLIGRRLGWLVGSLWVLITAGFFMIHLVPGDPVRSALGRNAPESLVLARRHQLGLDQPLLTQYWHYLTGLAHGQFGTSLFTGQRVSTTIAAQIGVSLQLALWSFVVIVVVAIPAGVVAAGLTRGGLRRRFELGFTSSTIVVATVPSFILAEALVYVFSVKLGWLPIAGQSGFASYILPVISLATAPTAVLMRLVRVEVLSVLGHDFVRTARAKRLPMWRIYLKEALPNALTGTLTIAGLMLTGLIAGTVLVENVFSWPGLGTSMVTSIRNKDYPLVEGIIIVYGIGVIIINLIVDVVLAVLDPRSTIGKGA
jgi:peptide/nickel transport system permease protein